MHKARPVLHFPPQCIRRWRPQRPPAPSRRLHTCSRYLECLNFFGGPYVWIYAALAFIRGWWHCGCYGWHFQWPSQHHYPAPKNPSHEAANTFCRWKEREWDNDYPCYQQSSESMQLELEDNRHTTYVRMPSRSFLSTPKCKRWVGFCRKTFSLVNRSLRTDLAWTCKVKQSSPACKSWSFLPIRKVPHWSPSQWNSAGLHTTDFSAEKKHSSQQSDQKTLCLSSVGDPAAAHDT